MIDPIRMFLVGIFSTLLPINAVNAASFDCGKASTATEKAICADFDLSVDDRILSYLFKKHLDWRKGREAWYNGKGTETPKHEILKDQSNWLSNSRNQCGGNLDCLNKVMDERIDHYLGLVRLEKPRSGSNYQVYIRSVNNAKNALRMFGSIFENIQRHGVLPSIENPNLALFSNRLPHLSGIDAYRLGDLEKVKDRIFKENSVAQEQVGFGKFVTVDYAGLNECLVGKSLQDVHWRGDWVLLSSEAYFECFTFYWPDGFVEDDTMSGGAVSVNDEPIFQSTDDFFYFPLLESKFINVDFSKVAQLFEICSHNNYQNVCQNDQILALDKLRALFSDKYIGQSFTDNAKTIELINQNEELISNLESCSNAFCIQGLYLSEIENLNKLTEFNGEIPPYCSFNDDGIYTCGDYDICMVGNSVLQLSKKGDEKYNLDVWTNYWEYDPWNGGADPSNSFEGIMYSSGTYPCTHDFYNFGSLSMANPGCTEPGPEPVNTMFRVYCDGENVLCPEMNSDSMFCALALMQ